MLITSSHPATAPLGKASARPGGAEKDPGQSQIPRDAVSLSSTEPEDGIKWGPALGVVGGVGAATALAGSGLGIASAVPAFLIGGVAGFVLVTEGVMKLIGNGGDTSATGPIAGAAGIVGGLGLAAGATSLALNYGSPMVGLGAGIVGAGLTLAYGLSLTKA